MEHHVLHDAPYIFTTTAVELCLYITTLSSKRKGYSCKKFI